MIVRHRSMRTGSCARDVGGLVFPQIPDPIAVVPRQSSTQHNSVNDGLTIRALDEAPTSSDRVNPLAIGSVHDGAGVRKSRSETIKALLILTTIGLWISYAIVTIDILATAGDPPRVLQGIDVLGAFALLSTLAVMIVFSLLVYNVWCAVASHCSIIRPGQAVGYMYIPFFNFYWIFFSGIEFVRAANVAILKKPSVKSRANAGLLIASVILYIVSFFFGLISGLCFDEISNPDSVVLFMVMLWILNTATTITWFLNIRNFSAVAIALDED